MSGQARAISSNIQEALVLNKKMQMEYKHYEGMGVPITWEILTRSSDPSDLDDLPHLYDIRSSIMFLNTFILCQIVLKCMI